MIAESDHFEWKLVWQALTDWQLYVCFLIYWGIVVPLYSIVKTPMSWPVGSVLTVEKPLFLLSIMNSLGYTGKNIL
jgi:hypothetical protein